MNPVYDNTFHGISDEMKKNIENWFVYHPPVGDQIERYARIRSGAKMLAEIIATCTPNGDEQKEAIMLLRKCAMMANAAIACDKSVNGEHE